MYDISILSGIPASVADMLPLEPLPARLQTLFSVSSDDIKTLTQQPDNNNKPTETLNDDDMAYGWVGCTSDDALAIKEHLFDLLVSLPSSDSNQAREKVWPRIRIKRGLELKATQRDLRRYRMLRRGLRRYSIIHKEHSPNEVFPNTGHLETDELITPLENTQETFDDASSTIDEKLIEPQSWSALAYSSFMWWALAGEKRTDLEEEAEHDLTLLRDPNYNHDILSNRPRSSGMSPGGFGTGDSPASLEMILIAYFHRLTTIILQTLAEVVEAAEVDEEQQSSKAREQDDTVFVTTDDMARMGLDIWSEGDRKFVKELVELYWGKRAKVQGARIECCGLRIC